MGFKKIRNIKSQQEMVGFVLIVVLVVIALMVFLIISVRNKDEDSKSIEISTLLNVVMEYTTECAIVYVPDYDTIEGLIKSAHRAKSCKNLNKDASVYLNETLTNILQDVMKTETAFSAYEFEVSEEGSEERIFWLYEGECSGVIKSAFRKISSEDLVVKLAICS